MPNLAQQAAPDHFASSHDGHGPGHVLTVPRGPSCATLAGTAGIEDAVQCKPPSLDGTVQPDGAREENAGDESCSGSHYAKRAGVKGGNGTSGSTVSWRHVFFSQSFALCFNGINDYVEVRQPAFLLRG